jgi:hypothetical protein
VEQASWPGPRYSELEIAPESNCSLTIFQVKSDVGPIPDGIQTESDEADAEMSQFSSEEEHIYDKCIESWTESESDAKKCER